MKLVLIFVGFVLLSVLITSVCIMMNLAPWQYFTVNCLAGAILGFISEMKA